MSSPQPQPLPATEPLSILEEDLAPYDQDARRASNSQLYGNSILSGSAVEESYKSDPDRFFNAKDPNLAIRHEKAQHRLVVYLKAQGKSNKKIAELTGMTPPWVSQILRQPWAQQLLVRELKEAGRDAIGALLAASAEDSVLKLIELRDCAEEASVQRGAANDLLDRFLGKPTQHVESVNKTTVFSESIDELNEQLQQLEDEEKRLIGKN